MSTPLSSRRLPLLVAHEDPLQRCVYCPKLCRATCPVSEAEGRESVTPWGKMSTAWFLGRGDVPLEPSSASLAWACTGCRACKERCDHGNDVSTVLADARADLFARGVAPAGASAVAAGFAAHEVAATAAADALAAARGTSDRGAAVLIGCSYLKNNPQVATDALDATSALLGGTAGRSAPVTPIGGCCGLPLLHAGDRDGFERAARRLAARVRGASDLVVVDPGCARALLVEYPRIGVTTVRPKLFADLAGDAALQLHRSNPGPPPRWHDPCQLGRGLGRFDGPRRALERVAGAPPLEFARNKESAECSGAGALLPITRPETSREIGRARLVEHRRLGAGKLVTGCGESLRRFRSLGEDAEDLATWVARGLGLRGRPLDSR